MVKYYVLLVILNILDLLGSYLLFGPDQEYNPICAYIWRNHGFESLIFFKVMLTLIPIAIIDCYHDTQPKRAKYAIILANVLVFIPVVLLGYLWSLL